MRIIVMSDSHGNMGQVERIIKSNPDADMFVHLGDGEREVAAVRVKYPQLDFRSVSGNCDYSRESPVFLIVEAGGARIFCTHGHRYEVRYGTDTLSYIARDNGCNAALYGHTHERYIGQQDGIDIMNPGSCSCPRDGNKPSYGIVDVTDAGVFMNIFNVGE